jgi:hypothetical protein
MQHFRRAASACINLNPLLSIAALHEPSRAQSSLSVRRFQDLPLPSVASAARSLGVRCVSAPQLLPIQVAVIFFPLELMHPETVSFCFQLKPSPRLCLIRGYISDLSLFIAGVREASSRIWGVATAIAEAGDIRQ